MTLTTLNGGSQLINRLSADLQLSQDVWPRKTLPNISPIKGNQQETIHQIIFLSSPVHVVIKEVTTNEIILLITDEI